MTTLTYTIPIPGSTLNSIAAPEISSAFQAILNWANGEIDPTNVSTTGGLLALCCTTRSSSYVAQNRDFVTTTGSSGVTVTLPAPTTANMIVGICNELGSGAATSVNGTSIVGIGLNSVSSFEIGIFGASVLLLADGSSWRIIAGMANTGWVPLSLANSVTAQSGFFVPAYRTQGDRVELSGVALTPGGGLTTGEVIATNLPAPASNVQPNVGFAAGSAAAIEIAATSSSMTATANLGAGSLIRFDGASYRLA